MNSNKRTNISAVVTTKRDGFCTSRLRQIAKEARALVQEVDQLRDLLRDFYQARHSYRLPLDPKVHNQIKERADRAFCLANQANRLLEELFHLPDSGRVRVLCDALQNAARRALRYNRQSLGCVERSPIGIIPLTYYRNFLRDNTERMYFLALHDLPSAYDFFCCTYVETPPGYQQEVHLHQYSEELTLVLEGSSDCAWFHEDEQGQLHEAGRVTAHALQAFRIPVGVPHTIENMHGNNRNLTIKLSMFIEDRVGQRDWQFARQRKSLAPVTSDHGTITSESWGHTIRFPHGHEGLCFEYCLIEVCPNRSLQLRPGPERSLLLFAGNARFRHCGEKLPIDVQASSIVRIGCGEEATIDADSLQSALLFSVDGLDHRHFLACPQEYPQYPSWLMDDIRVTLGGGVLSTTT